MADIQAEMKQEGMMVRKTIKMFALCAVAVAAFSAPAVDFSKAGYWYAEGSPRRVETLTTGWEFSLDGFKTSKRVALPHSIDEGEIGFEASGCVNRQQPAWYRRKFDWKRHGARSSMSLIRRRSARRMPCAFPARR